MQLAKLKIVNFKNLNINLKIKQKFSIKTIIIKCSD